MRLLDILGIGTNVASNDKNNINNGLFVMDYGKYDGEYDGDDDKRDSNDNRNNKNNKDNNDNKNKQKRWG